MPLYYNSQINKEIFFIHIPKTGGSSINKLFLDNNYISTKLSIKSQKQHALFNTWKNIIDKDVEKIVVIRNPIDRIISEIRGNYSYYSKIIDPFNIDKCIKYIFENELNRGDNHVKKIVDFIDINNLEKYNITIFKFEDNFYEEIIKKYNLKHFDNHIVGDTYNKNLNTILSENSIELIKSFYREDFEFLINYNSLTKQ